jgi:phospholipase/lecithinase/hemolysin
MKTGSDRTMKHLLAAAILASAPMSATAGPIGPLANLYVFGDSISDPGNLLSDPGFVDQVETPGLPIYSGGRFSNGPTWAELLGADLASGRNFAYGSARAATTGELTFDEVPGTPVFDVPDFQAQLASLQAALLAGMSLGAHPVGVVAFGGNDLRAALENPDPDAIPTALGTISAGVDALLDAGLEKVVVFGVPDLGQIPEILGSPVPNLPALATEASFDFNAALQILLKPKSNVHYFDLFGLLQNAAANPAEFGFTNVTEACIENPEALARDCPGYLFYDTIHPTGAGHAIIAEAVKDLVAPIPLPAGAWLLLTAFGILSAAGAARRT